MKFFVAYFIIFAPFFAKTNALKCLVCDSIYQSADTACQRRDCDEYSKEWLEFEDKFANEVGKLNSEDQVSLKAYYHNMTKLEKSLQKKSSTENVNDGGKFFDMCISKLGVYDGKPVKLKACGRKKWDSCKNDKDREIFESCSTCETDYCNTLKCYSCGDAGDRVDADISQITPCKDTTPNFCHGDATKCFSATGVKNGQKVEYRGCIYKNETQITTKFFEKEALSYYFCEKNLCNEESVNNAESSIHKCANDSCKNKHRYKKSETNEDDAKDLAEANHYFACRVCDGVDPDGFCSLTYCEQIMNSTKKKFNCLSASGQINGKQKVYKSCIYEGSNECEELKKKGYDSCSTCGDSYCNALKCYGCLIVRNYKTLQSCQDSTSHYETECADINDHFCNCYSAKTSLHGKDIRLKGCIMKKDIQNFTKYLDSYGFKHYTCEGSLCNRNDD